MTPTTIMGAGRGIIACQAAAVLAAPLQRRVVIHPRGGPHPAHRAATTPQPRLPRVAVPIVHDLAGGLRRRRAAAVF